MAISKNARVAKTVEKKGVDIFYGSRNEWVKQELPFPQYKLNQFFENAAAEQVVLCDDGNGLYITGKSYIDGGLLDPFRMYHRLLPKEIALTTALPPTEQPTE